MKDLRGKTAVITGAGSGIGRGTARILAQKGVNVVVCDINASRAEETAEEIRRMQVRSLAVPLDVSDRKSVYEAADRIEREMGNIHIIFNNAGIGSPRVPLEDTPDEDIDWLFGVNTLGVMNGIKAFVPKIKKHGQGGHVVNTASIAGLRTAEGMAIGLYSASKMAVVALSQALKESLRGQDIGVSVLCPAGVDTNILGAAAQRPDKFGGPIEREQPAAMAKALAEGLPPDEVGRCVAYAIEDGDMLFILTHPQTRRWIEDRHKMLMDAYDKCDEMVATLGTPRTSQV